MVSSAAKMRGFSPFFAAAISPATISSPPRPRPSGPPPVRLGSKRILFLPSNAVLGRNHLRAHAHVKTVIGLPQPVVDHRIDRQPVPHPETGPRLRQQIRSISHRLHPASDHNLRVLGLNRLRSKRYRFQSRTTHLVHCKRAHLFGETSVNCRLPRRVLSHSRLEHAAHNAFVDLRCVQPRPSYRLAHRKRPDLWRRKRLQRPLKLPHRRPHCGHNHSFLHPFPRHFLGPQPFATLPRPPANANRSRPPTPGSLHTWSWPGLRGAVFEPVQSVSPSV